MKRFFSQIKDKFKNYTESGEELSEEGEEGYVELNTEGGDEVKSKIMVRPFVMNDFEDIKGRDYEKFTYFQHDLKAKYKIPQT